MRAAIVRTPGATTNIEIVDVPLPEPGPQEIRIEVAAAGVNPIDLFTRRGVLHELGALAAGQVVGLGWEVAGTVDAVGAEVTALSVGERVAALVTDVAAPLAGYAEYLIVAADAAATIPGELTITEAATLPLSALTADQALDASGVQAGESLLVTGAAGMVGGYLVQLAHRRGIDVVAVASAADEAVVKSFGARTVMDRDTDVAAAINAAYPGGVNAAVDAADIGAPALESVRAGGTYVGLIGWTLPTSDSVNVVFVRVEQDGRRLAEIARLGLVARVADVLPLADAARAHDIAEKGGVRGRLVLTP